MTVYKLDDVFNVRTEPLIESYFAREDVDGKLTSLLTNNDKHLIIYGGSKQGKTSLVKKHIDEFSSYYDLSVGSHYSTPKDMYASLLCKISAKVKRSASKSKEDNISGEAEMSGGFKLPSFFHIGGKSKLGASSGGSESEEVGYIEPNFNDPNVIHSILVENDALKDFIILENVHFLKEEFILKFAEDLRTWHDLNVRFVILGVWKEQDELELNENNLRDRCFSLPVEPWNDEDLEEVVKTGSKLLKVSFCSKFREELVKSCLGSVGLLQEIMNKLCEKLAVKETLSRETEFKYEDYEAVLSDALGLKAREYRDPFKFLKKLSGKSNLENGYCYYWLVRFLYNTEGEHRNNLLTVKELADYMETEIGKEEWSTILTLPDDFNYYKAALKSLNKINEISRSISKENNLYFDEKELFIVNKYLVFYLKYADYESDLDLIIPPWEL